MNKLTLKQWFLRGKKPTAAQFSEWMDSYWHKDEKLPISSVEQLASALSGKQEKTDNALETNSKEIVPAINEVKQAVDSIVIPEVPDISGKQDIHDENLQTDSKEIVPAINEVKVLAESCHCPTFNIKLTEDNGAVTLIRVCGKVVSSYGYGGDAMSFIIGDLLL